MKLQISFDMPDLNKALEIASKIQEYADILEIGTPLLHQYGAAAVVQFREKFPEKMLLADAKIVDRAKDAISIFTQADANWISVLSGADNEIIHAACTAAHQSGKKILLDLIDSTSIGQSALEAKNLGVDALLFHQPFDESESLMFSDKWGMVRNNTKLPIFISAHINQNNVEHIVTLKPDGIVVGKAIVEAENPAQEAAFFKQIALQN